MNATSRQILLALLTAGLALSLAACGDADVGAAPQAETRTAVRAESVRQETLTPLLSVSGLVEAQAQIELAFRVTGFVERFEVDEGDRVGADQVLAVLDLADFDRDVRGARARQERAGAHARNASQAFERQRQLRENGTSSERAYDEARSAHDMARAEHVEARMELERAEDHQRKATLRSPVDGYVARRLLEPHELATSNVPVFHIVQLDEVTVRAAIADTELSRIAKGGAAFVSSPQWGERRFEAEISQIDVAADPVTRTVPFEVALPNPALSFRPNQVVRVEIPTSEPEPHILVPLSSVLRDSRLAPFCFVASEDGSGLRAEQRPVTLGAVFGDRVVIEGGLATGEQVITRGQHFLRPGDALRIVEE
jgi:RND family efflux transporter MFP subunit